MSFLNAQNGKLDEFQINSISGILLNELTEQGIPDIKIRVMSGDKLIKSETHSTDDGSFLLEPVGFVWKPRLVITSRIFGQKVIYISKNELDDQKNITFPIKLRSLPKDQQIPSIGVNSLSDRANMFFRKGNVFYYLSRVGRQFNSERVVIKTIASQLDENGYLVININGNHFDPLGCYVPQLGNYENLAMILDDYFPTPVFHSSGYPMLLENQYLESHEIFGTVMNATTGEPIFGADVQIEGMALHRITSKDGRFRFKIPHPGTYTLLVKPPSSEFRHISQNQILIRQAKGGWVKSDQYLVPN